MARSRRKHPIFGMTTVESEKADKIAGHRRTRAAARIALAAERDPPSHRLTENPWTYNKDGKRWWSKAEPEEMRK
jgi:hypothetical protein